jgi:RimJ/RimL family protein N-acetyltransferase
LSADAGTSVWLGIGDHLPMSVPRLVGERVTLRPIDKADRGPLRAILAEPGVARWWGTKPLDWQDERAITRRPA